MDPILLAVLKYHLRRAKCCGTCNYFAVYCGKDKVCTCNGDHETDETLVCKYYTLSEKE